MKVMISKFFSVGRLILIFIRTILPPPNYLNFPRGKSFLKQVSFHSLYKVSTGVDGAVFS